MKNVEQFAINLMTNNKANVNLLNEGWAFKINNRLSRSIGRCNHTRKVIELSGKLLPTMKKHEIEDTILHEIAHAIAGYSAGHGAQWKRLASCLGATPAASVELEVEPQLKWSIIYKNGNNIEVVHTMSRRKTIRPGMYIKGREETKGKLFCVETSSL